MSALAKFIFVSASWCPVYLLLGALAWDDNKWLAIPALIVSVASFGSLSLIEFVVRKKHAKEYINLTSCYERKDDIFMYVLTYIPPFFAIDVKSTAKVLALILLYVFIFISYVRLRQFHLNPLFVFFGYRILQITTDQGQSLYLIAKASQLASVGDRVRVATIGDIALMA